MKPRIPVTLVQIDMDFCNLSYGVSPCSAQIGVTGSQKCFNTNASCQDGANYDKGILTLTFSTGESDRYFPINNFLPFIKSNNGKASVTTTAAEINPAGSDGNKSPLGRRESVTITFTDAPYNDNLVDKYVDERSYDPSKKGSFWAKFLARNPYYNARGLRILEGFVGQPINEFLVRHYIIDTITPPNAKGEVQVKASDIIRKIDLDKAEYPFVVDCTIAEEVTTSQDFVVAFGSKSDFEITDDIVSYGYIRVNDEIINYSGVTEDLALGTITFTGCVRGTYGTEISEHSVDDDVFRCARMQGKSWRIAAWLLENAGKIDQTYIPVFDWDAACEPWISEFDFDTLLIEPVTVNELVAELSLESLFYIWWDAYANVLKIKPAQPPEGAPVKLNDFEHILGDTMVETVDDKARVSQFRIYYNQRNLTEDKDKIVNYRNAQFTVDELSEGEDQFGEAKIRNIFSRWIRNQVQALILGYRYIGRYNRSVSSVSFDLDYKDNDISVGDTVDVSTRRIVDFNGDVSERRYEVVSKKQNEQGHIVSIKAQIFSYGGFTGVRYIYFSPDDYPENYTDATEQQKQRGFWFADDNGKMPDGTDGFRYF